MNDISILEKEFGDLSKYNKCPPFWVPKPEQAMSVIESLKEATVRTIGSSAGGREIIAIEYGQKEPVDATTDNLQSAIASAGASMGQTGIFPEAFYGTKRRERQVLAIQGAIHGGELTGTVAAINLCKIIETGEDLRGKTWPRLQELARKARIVIIPWLNPDGTSRWPLANPTEAPGKLAGVCLQGIARDGTRFKYPAVKAIWPIPPESVAYMGAYYNDNGVNLQYDFVAVERQPETTAWMRYYLDERPDGALIWHCNAGSMIGPPEYYLPPGCQLEMSRIGGAVRSRLLRDGYEIGRLSLAGLPGMGKPFMEQSTATYFVCGAMPVMCELPSGTKSYPHSCDEMLDIGLITIEEVLFYADRDGLRPYELWDKVKRQREENRDK